MANIMENELCFDTVSDHEMMGLVQEAEPLNDLVIVGQDPAHYVRGGLNLNRDGNQVNTEDYVFDWEHEGVRWKRWVCLKM